MGELKIIIWIVIGIIYLISRARGKNASAPAPKQTDRQPKEEPVSFEDLLREIQASKVPKPQPKPVLAPVFDVKDYDDEIETEKAPLEQTNYNYRDHDQIYATYENAKEQAFHRPSMEETLKLEHTIVRYGQFKGYQQEVRPSLAAEYARGLKDPANFRKAFILSEILNRRF